MFGVFVCGVGVGGLHANMPCGTQLAATWPEGTLRIHLWDVCGLWEEVEGQSNGVGMTAGRNGR